ncbi:hypothetical protein TW83_09925 [Paracoccus sp. S4493]|uniref:terminase gpA endonuclease subunit n=1 Tax=Paracoccus sp. S4493 TaxID=579490 RepID=UPI0005FA158F|nr:terminase gpA endonuclease subunit [Paracoccus sp. S4493]KJZ31232.1 hypothetical protein TW83_09925 [Paracoccus sp. S4493]
MNNPLTAGIAKFSFDDAPYQREILETMSDNRYEGVAVVAPSRSGKSVMGLPFLQYTAVVDPKDTMIITPSRDFASKFSKGDFDSYIEANPKFKEMIRPGRSSNSLFFKILKNGMIISTVWPSKSNAAGVNRGVLFFQDYDRMVEDVGGEGSPFDLFYGRTKIYGSRKKILVESSPANLPREIEPFEPKSLHEAPPYPGIFGLYNSGTRECWYWQCVNTGCREWFEAHSRYFEYPDEGSIDERAANVKVVCPHCGEKYGHDTVPGKYDLNLSGKWVPDGMYLDKEGNLQGEALAPNARMRSFWLNGAAAAFHDWGGLVSSLLHARAEADKTGEEKKLKATLNGHFALPFFPRSLSAGLKPEDLKKRADSRPYARKVVPAEARYVVTTVDTQGGGEGKSGYWIVQSHAFALDGSMWVIHRKMLNKSKRPIMIRKDEGDDEVKRDDDGNIVYHHVRPHLSADDWDVLADYLIDLKFPVEGREDLFLRPAIIGVDSNGGDGRDDAGDKTGVTDNAYKFWRKLRARGDGTSARIILLKGEPKDRDHIIEMRLQSLEKRKSPDVPVAMITSGRAKDIFWGLLAREPEEPGYVHLPSHEKVDWFRELLSEHKVGERWVQRRKRNEAWDLCVYAHALIRLPTIRGDTLGTTQKIPDFALEPEKNKHAILIRDGQEVVTKVDRKKRLEELAKSMNGA